MVNEKILCEIIEERNNEPISKLGWFIGISSTIGCIVLWSLI